MEEVTGWSSRRQEMHQSFWSNLKNRPQNYKDKPNDVNM